MRGNGKGGSLCEQNGPSLLDGISRGFGSREDRNLVAKGVKG